MADRVAAFREQAMLFGDARSIVGVMCTPTQAPSVSCTVVILNSGIIHRVGANRMHVQLARALASQGIPTLRFDLSGIGDSSPRTDSLPLADGIVEDIKVVLDQLSSVNDTSFVLAGLCSGALYSLVYSAIDSRVDGLILMDLLLPHTRGYWVRNVKRRMQRAWNLRDIVTGGASLVRKLAIDAGVGSPVAKPDELYPMHMIQKALDERFRVLTARDVQMLAVFTDGLEAQHNYREQLLDAFPGVNFGKRLQLEYFDDSDHTFSDEASRTQLISLISTWLTTAYVPQIRVTEVATEPAATASVADREDISF